MIFPIGDTNVKGGAKPFFSYTFIILNVALFIVQLTSQGALVCEYATIPNEILAGRKMHTLVSSMFLHGGWLHLIGNMLFLWVFADNIEATVGNFRFLIFYIMGGLFATGLHMFFELYFGGGVVEGCCQPCLSNVNCAIESVRCSGSTPSLGASGAISAVLGAYVVLFPKSRIKVFFFFTTFTVSAMIFLGLWFIEQLIAGVGSIRTINALTGGVAWWAHIGGFIFGLLYGLVFKKDIEISYSEQV